MWLHVFTFVHPLSLSLSLHRKCIYACVFVLACLCMYIHVYLLGQYSMQHIYIYVYIYIYTHTHAHHAEFRLPRPHWFTRLDIHADIVDIYPYIIHIFWNKHSCISSMPNAGRGAGGDQVLTPTSLLYART